jgi:hypothetical protein
VLQSRDSADHSAERKPDGTSGLTGAFLGFDFLRRFVFAVAVDQRSSR